MSNKKTRAQHIVPVLYLDNFSIPGSPKKVYAWRKDQPNSQKPLISATTSVCVQNDFYENSLLADHVGINFIECTVNQLYEGEYKEHLKQAIVDALNPRHKLSNRDMRRLAKYMAYQYLRTSRFNTFLDIALEQPAASSARQPLSAAHASVLLDDWSGGGDVQALQELMLKRSWITIINDVELSGGYNFASDNPVCVINASAEFPQGNHFPLITAESCFYFPLSPKVALLLLDTTVRPSKVKLVSKKLLEMLNCLVFQQADRAVISCHSDFSSIAKEEALTAQGYRDLLSRVLPDVKTQFGNLFSTTTSPV